jgi:hypothetical protein
VLTGLTEAILKKFAEDVIAGIRSRIPNVTGESSASLAYRIDAEGLTIYSSKKYFTVLETGRKPTSPGAPKGNPTLREQILEWVKAKPIIPNDITQESLAYLISRKIHEEGSLLYRQGGKSGVISESINDKVVKEKLIDVLSDSFRDYVINEFVRKSLD